MRNEPNDALKINGDETLGADTTFSMTTPQQLQMQKIGHWSCVEFDCSSECVAQINPISSQTSAQGNTEAVKKNTENMNESVFTY